MTLSQSFTAFVVVCFLPVVSLYKRCFMAFYCIVKAVTVKRNSSFIILCVCCYCDRVTNALFWNDCFVVMMLYLRDFGRDLIFMLPNALLLSG